MKKKSIRISTIPLSLDVLLQGQLRMLSEHYEVVGVSSPGEELDKVAQREGIRTSPFPWNGKFLRSRIWCPCSDSSDCSIAKSHGWFIP